MIKYGLDWIGKTWINNWNNKAWIHKTLLWERALRRRRGCGLITNAEEK